MEEVERKLERLAHVERGQDELRQMLAALSHQIGELMCDRSSNHTRSESPVHRAQGSNQARGAQREDPHLACARDERRREASPVTVWGDDRADRRQTLGRKLELLIFSRDDAYGWLACVERFFHINKVEDYDKMDLVLVAMEGEALIWYQWWEEQVPFPTWREFKEDLMKRFQSGVARNPYGPLLRVKHTDSVQ